MRCCVFPRRGRLGILETAARAKSRRLPQPARRPARADPCAPGLSCAEPALGLPFLAQGIGQVDFTVIPPALRVGTEAGLRAVEFLAPLSLHTGCLVDAKQTALVQLRPLAVIIVVEIRRCLEFVPSSWPSTVGAPFRHHFVAVLQPGRVKLLAAAEKRS